jgi:hypothetical protein
VWFALSWVVSLACMRGLLRRQAAFLRTPKRKEGQSVWQAIRSSQTESAIAALSVAGAVVLPLSAFSVGTVVLALLLLWLALLYSSAPWASFAAEGIRLTPQRREFLTSSQNLGDWPERRVPTAARVAVPVALAAAVLAAFILASPSAPKQQPPATDLPQIQQIPPRAQSTPTPTPAPTPTTTPASAARQNAPAGG